MTDVDEVLRALEVRYSLTFCSDYRALLCTSATTAVPILLDDKEYDMRMLFGLQDAQMEYDLRNQLEHFFAPEWLSHFYPIGKDAGGNLLVQIASGKYAENIGIIDHEIELVLSDLVQAKNNEIVLTDESISLPFETFIDATTDDAISLIVEWGVLIVLPGVGLDYFKQKQKISQQD